MNDRDFGPEAPPAYFRDLAPHDSVSGSADGLLSCTYSASDDRDWHNAVPCSNGANSQRRYLRSEHTYAMQDEIMESARQFEGELNAGEGGLSRAPKRSTQR